MQMMEGAVSEIKLSAAKSQVYRPTTTTDFSGTYFRLLLIKLTVFEKLWKLWSNIYFVFFIQVVATPRALKFK